MQYNAYGYTTMIDFQLRNYKASWDARERTLNFAVPLQWLMQQPCAMFDDDGDFCGVDIDEDTSALEMLYRDAAMAGVVEYLGEED